MTELVRALLEQLKNKSYRQERSSDPDAKAVIYPVDCFGFNLGIDFTPKSADGNLAPDYERLLAMGMDKLRDEISLSRSKASEPERIAFADDMLAALDKALCEADAHRDLAEKKNNKRLFEALGTVPRRSPESFYQALVFVKFIIYTLRRGGVMHLGLGRFDQYMLPYWQMDLDRGVSEDRLFEELEAFFVSINYDSDIYAGVQQGDNGQSLVLGGFGPDGSYLFNSLSRRIMEASLELELIDPKINLRVGKNTPDEIFLLGTRLTKKGLGFPQYCNDDVVIPGLMKLGYDREDAYNYGVAACWEFIIPGIGADIPNVDTMNFPLVTGEALRCSLEECGDFESLMNKAELAIRAECDRLVAKRFKPSNNRNVLLSIFMRGPSKSLASIYQSAKYKNLGCHGAGIANAADALAAVKKCVYEDKTVTKKELLSALEADFEGFDQVRSRLKACPKMGNNDPYVDSVAYRLMDCFSDSLNNRPNGRGGIWRAGTGSAMEYILSAQRTPATADGRRAKDAFSSSFSPSLDVKTDGILSVIQSFTNYDMERIINGGPLTLEIHDTVLKNEMGIEKTARLVKLFVELGGHQLQLNSINRERLLDAQRHPENYPGLIVRVWGWSGYFNELDLPYQNHVIRRTHYSV